MRECCHSGFFGEKMTNTQEIHQPDSTSVDTRPLAKDPGSVHVTVLLSECVDFLAPKPGGLYLDCTLGLGGHTEAILRRAADTAGGNCKVIGLDRDPEALVLARKRLAAWGDNFQGVESCFSDLDAALEALGYAGPCLDGVLADLGVSSLQIDSAERGFSFLHDGPLDMRMGKQEKSAAYLINHLSVAELTKLISDLGEDPQAGRIAKAIDSARSRKTIETTLELAEIVKMAYPAKWRNTARNHPATRTFQALRMLVNEELLELTKFLSAAVSRLNPGGRLAVISFHSLEDRMVKHFMREEAKDCICPPFLPVCKCNKKATLKVLTSKPVLPSAEELKRNPRSSSAKLRVAEKI